MEKIETVVIGAGQAGLAMSHHLTVLGCEHVIFERARVAERWRSQRWDSLMFQFPNWSIELPGRSYSSGDPDGFAPKDEVLRVLEGYCAWIKAPVRSGVNVSAVRVQSTAGRYEIISDIGPVATRNVVIATGPYQRPRRPPCHRGLPARVVQVHAADYRNPAALPDGAVLVVGSGASGCQIADELLESGRRVYLSIGQYLTEQILPVFERNPRRPQTAAVSVLEVVNPRLRHAGAYARLLPSVVVHRLNRVGPVDKYELRMLPTHTFDYCLRHAIQHHQAITAGYDRTWVLQVPDGAAHLRNRLSKRRQSFDRRHYLISSLWLQTNVASNLTSSPPCP